MTDIGVIKEIKENEYRVALTPAGARKLVQAGHRIKVQRGAGEGSGFPDAAYRDAGCELVAVEVAWESELVLKVKEPLPSEYGFLGQQILFTFLHLAGVAPDLTARLLQAGTTAIAYGTVQDQQGRLPLLAPMSAIAGNMAVNVGNYYLARSQQGKGTLLGTVFEKSYGKVAILGDGVVGRHAARVATAMGAETLIFGRHPEREAELKRTISERLQLVPSTPQEIGRVLRDADLLIGAVLHPGSRAPHVVTEEMVAGMQPGSVIVDVSIDQGGCIATSRPTTHSDPVYRCHEVIHYCVTNMPGAYPRTATQALTRVTLDYVRRLADQGIEVLRSDPCFAAGLNIYQGYITNQAVAESLARQAQYRAFADL